MDWLCNTIPGDAPLYTMFRKEGELIKCPFRGPFAFSYSKGDSSQVPNLTHRIPSLPCVYFKNGWTLWKSQMSSSENVPTVIFYPKDGSTLLRT